MLVCTFVFLLRLCLEEKSAKAQICFFNRPYGRNVHLCSWLYPKLYCLSQENLVFGVVLYLSAKYGIKHSVYGVNEDLMKIDIYCPYAWVTAGYNARILHLIEIGEKWNILFQPREINFDPFAISLNFISIVL